MPRPSLLRFLRAALLVAVLLLSASPAGLPVARADESTDESAAALQSLALDSRFGIAEGFRNPEAMMEIGAGWERVVLSWADIQPDGPEDFSWLGRSLPDDLLDAELARGVRVVGLLQFTPAWAAEETEDPAHSQRAVPRNLDLPVDDPENYWARFVETTVEYYRGRIDDWIIWNEPEFRPGDPGAGESYTWLGTDEQFARLMQVAYRAAKGVNPGATVAFPGTSYWVEQNQGREQFYSRFLSLVAADPDAPAHNFYHDAVGLNLYRAPDDLVRVHAEFKAAQAAYGLDQPLWLLELNAMPTTDPEIPCPDRYAAHPIQTTLEEQAAYAVQAFALGAAVGYQRMGFYQMVDDGPCVQPAVWGITRDDGTRRPVAGSLAAAIAQFSSYRQAQFVPLVRATQGWSPWPDDPASYVPNWQVYQVALDLPGGRRVTVLWNGDGTPLRVRVPLHDPAAVLLDEQGAPVPLEAVGSQWVVDLPAATARFPLDPPGYHFIGGAPRLLVESGVPAGTPVAPPSLS